MFTTQSQTRALSHFLPIFFPKTRIRTAKRAYVSVSCSKTPFDEMIAQSLPLFNEIATHPFVKGLNAGTMPETDFLAFLVADATLFLPPFASIIRLISERFNQPTDSFYSLYHVEQFTQLARRIDISAKNRLAFYHVHHSQHSAATQDIPAISCYLHYMATMAKESSIPHAVASVSSCLWLYDQLDKQINLTNCPPDHMYSQWHNRHKFKTDVIPLIASTPSVIGTVKTLINGVTCPIEKEKNNMAYITPLKHELSIFNSICPNEPVAKSGNFLYCK